MKPKKNALLQEAAKLEQFHKYEAMQMERYKKMHRNGTRRLTIKI